MITAKYRGFDKDPANDVPISWNVHPEGLPVRHSDTPAMVEDRLLEHAGVIVDFQSRIFKIPEDMAAYAQVQDWNYNGMTVITKEVVQEVKDKVGEWVVWLSWCNIRGHIPKKPQLGA